MGRGRTQKRPTFRVCAQPEASYFEPNLNCYSCMSICLAAKRVLRFRRTSSPFGTIDRMNCRSTRTSRHGRGKNSGKDNRALQYADSWVSNLYRLYPELFLRLRVGPPLRNALLCCSSRFNAIAPCSIACATSSCMPPNRNAIASCSIACATSSRMLIQSQRCRAMLTRVRNVVAHAHLLQCHHAMLTRMRNVVVHAHRVATLSRHAHSHAQPRRACPPSRNDIAPCPLACGS
jgi:hypothetical protein